MSAMALCMQAWQEREQAVASGPCLASMHEPVRDLDRTCRSALAGAAISVVLISCVAWGAGGFEHDTLRTMRPVQLFFSTYAEDALVKVRRLELSAILLQPSETEQGSTAGWRCAHAGG